MKQSNFKVLKLNKIYFPLDIVDWKDAVTDIFSEVVLPVRVAIDADGEISELTPYSFNHWLELEPRESENVIGSAHGKFIIPNMVICATYNRLPPIRILFPTKKNIWKRDKNICGYTGKPLTREQLSIDHIIPSSRGGENTWENLITCDRELNSWKSDCLPEECDPPLKLRIKPQRPNNGRVLDLKDEKWNAFLKNSS
tara:strand:- start:1665 stop:2258 length:594 start_codon:yes stop_codon:yes gene_type:complete